MAESSNRPTALFVSPHLDDVAFSCGGTLALLAERGWRTVLVTVFTRSVPDPAGFALACQTDKGVARGTDYMALRREEDREAARLLGAGEPVWLDLPEAPHRGYHSASALFSSAAGGDEVWRDVTELLETLIEAHAPDLVFAPQALGAHVDHLQIVRAVRELTVPATAWYRDAPYATRHPGSRPSPLLPEGLAERAVDVTETLETKLEACAAYTTQLGFQFGGEIPMRRALKDFAAAEARRSGGAGKAAEALLSPDLRAGFEDPSRPR